LVEVVSPVKREKKSRQKKIIKPEEIKTKIEKL
jgi:hypothetical protein